MVTGPATGNAFALGITHVIHDIVVTNNSLVVELANAAPTPTSGAAFIQGFQIVPVPVPSAAMILAGGLVCLGRRRRSVG
jgi:hypothetical protein